MQGFNLFRDPEHKLPLYYASRSLISPMDGMVSDFMEDQIRSKFSKCDLDLDNIVGLGNAGIQNGFENKYGIRELLEKPDTQNIEQVGSEKEILIKEPIYL